MSKNQVLAALQIENSEIRLVVGEYYNDLFYVICKECLACTGTNGIRFVDNNKVIESISAAVASASKKINAPIERVILCVPGYRFKKECREIKTILENKKVEEHHIIDAINESYNTNVGSDYEIISLLCSYYKLNGIVYPKMPLGENGEILNSQVDLICGDKLTLYDYVSTVEKSGLKIMEICQDGLAACKEAALFEQSFNSYVINIHLESSHTVYTLISNGRVTFGTSDNSGYDQLIKPIMNTFKLSYRDANRILFRYALIGDENGENRIINKWETDGKTNVITYNDLQKCLIEATNEFLAKICAYCLPINGKYQTNIVITGQGAALQQISEVLTEKFKRNVSCYCPDKLGVREHKWCSLVGSFDVYRDNKKFDNNVVNSVDVALYKEKIIDNNDSFKSNDVMNRLKIIADKFFGI